MVDRIGLMEHAPLLYDELDAMENLRYFAGLYGIREDRCGLRAGHRAPWDSTRR